MIIQTQVALTGRCIIHWALRVIDHPIVTAALPLGLQRCSHAYHIYGYSYHTPTMDERCIDKRHAWMTHACFYSSENLASVTCCSGRRFSPRSRHQSPSHCASIKLASLRFRADISLWHARIETEQDIELSNT